VGGISVAAVPARGGTDGLLERLRAQTARWHEKVEATADIPGRVHTRADYVDLLGSLAGLHIGLEAQLSAQVWDRAWVGVGVDIAAHCRAGLVVDDLEKLGVTPGASTVQPSFPCFGQALGCLYVLEGSSLGGRIVAGMVCAAIGEVPTAFLTGRGRGQQWPVVRRALRCFQTQGGDGDAVVDGAVSAFAVFARHLAVPGLQR